MKKLALLLLVLGIVDFGFGQRAFGIGAVAGAPSGLSARFDRSSAEFIDLLLAWDLDQSTFFQGHYDFNLLILEKGADHHTNLYAGPGFFFRSEVWDRTHFGFSGNFGVGWTFKQSLEFFADLSPKIGLIRQTDFIMTGGLGFRYLF